MTAPNLVLHQFPYSHYNEKARWALDWKGASHRRVSYLPGPHAPQIKRLSGETTTPVLVVDGRVVAGSSAIVAEVERLFPERPLFPADPRERERAAEIARHFDDAVGPRVRRALFSVLLEHGDYFCHLWSHERSWPVRRFYRALFPIARRIVRPNVGLDVPGAAEEAIAASLSALDLVARESAATGQLVGDRFTHADLTAASLLAPLLELDHPDMDRPRPVPAPLADFFARFAGHPGADWVRRQYRAHRSAARAAASR